jgi:hypothetical protein
LEAEHTGLFDGHVKRQITGGRIYVDVGTLLKQIGVA